MSETEQTGAAIITETVLAEMPIHFLKGTGFRVVHADGVWFGANPHGGIHLTFYSERTPIPKRIVVRIDENGHAIEDEAKRESKEGLVREMEVDIVLTVRAAVQLQIALAENLRRIKETNSSVAP